MTGKSLNLMTFWFGLGNIIMAVISSNWTAALGWFVVCLFAYRRHIEKREEGLD